MDFKEEEAREDEKRLKPHLAFGMRETNCSAIHGSPWFLCAAQC